MDKQLVFFASIIAIILISVSDATAIGISPGKVEINYDPATGIDFERPFFVRNNAGRDIVAKISLSESDLLEYAELSTTEIPLKPGASGGFTVRLRIPRGLTTNDFMGVNNLWIVATESVPDQDQLIVVRTSVATRIEVSFPYPGRYLEISSFSINAVNEGLESPFEFKVRSRGEEHASFTAKLEVFGRDNETLIVREFTRSEISPGETLTRGGTLPSSTFSPGIYPAKLTVFYDDKTITQDASLRIGEEEIEFVSFNPQELLYRTINPVRLTIESLWGEHFDNVYAEITLGPTTTRTPTERLPRFGTVSFNHYIDTTGIEPGKHDATIKVFFSGKTKEFPVPLTVLTEQETREIRGETQERSFNMIHFMIGLSILVLILLIVNILFLFRKKK